MQKHYLLNKDISNEIWCYYIDGISIIHDANTYFNRKRQSNDNDDSVLLSFSFFPSITG